MKTALFATFRPGDRVICIHGSLASGLCDNQTYTVVEQTDPETASKVLVELAEIPGILFHPSRFIRSPSS